MNAMILTLYAEALLLLVMVLATALSGLERDRREDAAFSDEALAAASRAA